MCATGPAPIIDRASPGRLLGERRGSRKEVRDAREDLAHLVLRSDARGHADGLGREVEELGQLEGTAVSRRILLFGWLAALLLAASAVKNN
jgi:hypothetical protein